jgi:hypothetical protein
MVAFPNTYRIDSHLKDKIASNLAVLDIRDHPDDIALPGLEVLRITIPRIYKEAISDPKYVSEWNMGKIHTTKG